MKVKRLSVLMASLFFVALFGNTLADDCKGCSGCSKKTVEKAEQKADLKPQTTCPVMGGAINKETFVDHNGKRIYFCCAPCIEKFNKNPEKYLEILEKEGVKLEEAPQTTDA